MQNVRRTPRVKDVNLSLQLPIIARKRATTGRLSLLKYMSPGYLFRHRTDIAPWIIMRDRD